MERIGRIWRRIVVLFVTSGLCWGCAASPDPVAPKPEPRNPLVQPPQPARSVIGVSIEQRPIEMLTFGDTPNPVLVIGGIHGSEPTSVDVARRLATNLLNDPAIWYGRTGKSVAIIPVANPDGYARLARTNAAGVDVNRNFPAKNFRVRQTTRASHGPEPLSEPESRAIKEAMDTLKPRMIISIHSIEDDRHCNNFDGPAEHIATLMSEHNGYPVTPTMGYPTPGSLGSYAGIDLQIPIITLELPRNQPGEQAWSTNREALLAAIQTE